VPEATVARPRFLKLDPERRDRLLEAAAEEFAARGYDTASLNKLIERIGLSKGQFYYYFDDKADLFATVLGWAWDRAIPAGGLDVSRLDTDSFWPALRRLSSESRRTAQSWPWFAGLFRHLVRPPDDPAVRRLLSERIEQARHIQFAIVRRGQELGCIRRDVPDDLLLALMFEFGMAFRRWYLDHWDSLTPDRREHLAAFGFDAIRRMLEPPADPPEDR
jgi:AcrR family transcriptional regulator